MRAGSSKGHQALALAQKLVAEHWEQMPEEPRAAFADMVERGRPLTDKQAEWVHAVAERLGISASRNLFSSLSREAQEAERARAVTTLPWERGEQQRPLKPPGRS